MPQLPLLHHFRAGHGILARLSTRDREAAREAGHAFSLAMNNIVTAQGMRPDQSARSCESRRYGSAVKVAMMCHP